MKTILIFSLVLLSSIHILAQKTNKDSVKTNEQTMNFSTYFNPNTFLYNLSFGTEINDINFKSEFLQDSTSILMRTRLMLADFYTEQQPNYANQVLSPLQQQYSASQNLKFLKQVLGTVQLGAVGYLAYAHLKKYGFLKKK